MNICFTTERFILLFMLYGFFHPAVGQEFNRHNSVSDSDTLSLVGKHGQELRFDSQVISRTLESPSVKTQMPESKYSLSSDNSNTLSVDIHSGIERHELWKGGSVDIYSHIYDLPGLTSVSIGSLSLRQDFKALSFSVSAQAYRGWNPYTGGISSLYGIGGFSSYSLNDHFTLCAFGSYSPGVTGWHSFGGFIDWRISEHWGAELGVEYNYYMFLHQRDIEPIITPYYRYNDGSKLRIPLGPLVKRGLGELIHNIRH